MSTFLWSATGAAFALGVFFLLNAVSDIQLTAAVAAFGTGAVLVGVIAVLQQLKRIEAMTQSVLQLRARDAREATTPEHSADQ